jgi:hypothetical protein
MGDIIFWAIIRIAIVIPLLWLLTGYIDYKLWWIIMCFTVYGVIIHPAISRFKKFELKNKSIIEDTLCSSCKHFDVSAVLCMKYDKHPTKDYLPCEGNDWEPDIQQT